MSLLRLIVDMDLKRALKLNYLKTGKPLISSFLSEYSSHLKELKTFFNNNDYKKFNYNTVPMSVIRMKDFVIEYGGIKAVELLAEYEKSCSIGDFSTCCSLEKPILEELNLFKETWVSMLC